MTKKKYVEKVVVACFNVHIQHFLWNDWGMSL